MPLRRGRDAQRWDRERLRTFRAVGSEAYVDEVNGYVAEVVDWKDQEPGRVVRVFSDEDDDIVAVLAYQVFHEPTVLVYVALLAIRQGKGRQGYATDIAHGLIRHLDATHPGCRVTCKVVPGNTAMHQACSKWGAGEPTYSDDGYILYEFELPQSLPGVVTPEP